MQYIDLKNGTKDIVVAAYSLTHLVIVKNR